MNSPKRKGDASLSGQAAYEHLQFAGRSDPGHVRSVNEDHFGALPEHGVFIVADGVGGGEHGAYASKLVVGAVSDCLGTHSDKPGFDNLYTKWRMIVDAIGQTNEHLLEYARNQNIRFSASTALAIVFDPNQPGRALSLHAGDSRLYRLRNREMELLTTDHSPSKEWDKEQLDGIPQQHRNRLTRAIGLRPDMFLEKTEILVQPGDIFLLCSDGLYGFLPSNRIQLILSGDPDRPLPELADELIQGALDGGGGDNITAVLIRIGQSPSIEKPVDQLFRENLGDEDDDIDGMQTEAGHPAFPDESGGEDDTLIQSELAPEMRPAQKSVSTSIVGQAIEFPNQNMSQDVQHAFRLRLAIVCFLVTLIVGMLILGLVR